MAAPPLTVGLVKAGQIPAASGDSQIYATVSWGDAAAESPRVTAGVAQEDWGASVDLPQPSSLCVLSIRRPSTIRAAPAARSPA